MKPHGLRICLAPSLLVHLVRPPCFHKILLSFPAFSLRCLLPPSCANCLLWSGSAGNAENGAAGEDRQGEGGKIGRANRPSKRLRSAGATSAAEESRLCQPEEAKAASQLAGDFSGCRAGAPLPCIFRRVTGNPPSRVQTPLGEAPEGRGETAKPSATTEPAARQKNACVPR